MLRSVATIERVALVLTAAISACDSSAGTPGRQVAAAGSSSAGASGAVGAGSSSGGAGGGSAAAGSPASGGSGMASGGVTVVISPQSTSAYVGGEVKFTSTVMGTTVNGVAWAIEEGGTDGKIDESGLFVAPTAPGIYHVTATSQDPSKAFGRATVAVSRRATGEPGVWENVTPPELNLDPDFMGGNFGTQELQVDPANPAVLYLSACYQGYWKSTDYGLTFKKVSAKDGPMDLGRPWAFVLDQNPNRDPMTPPVMYSAQGYGPDQGVFVSEDGAVTWKHYKIGGTQSDNDLGSLSVDPNDKNHLIAGMRPTTHVFESKDGGKTWEDRGEAGTTPSNHVYFVTSTTWLLVSEWGDGSAGTRRTTDSGKTWTKVSSCERFHGSSQPFMDGTGLIVSPCVEGILKSTDYGETWTKVAEGAASAVVGTGSFLYVATGWATIDKFDPDPRRAERATAMNWSSYTTTPAGMTNGPHRAAVTFDGEKNVIVSSNWVAGVWRYVEP